MEARNRGLIRAEQQLEQPARRYVDDDSAAIAAMPAAIPPRSGIASADDHYAKANLSPAPRNS